MANKLISMSKIRSILKLHSEGIGKKSISAQMQVSRNTVKRYIHLYKVLGLTVEKVMEMSDKELDQLFSKEEIPSTEKEKRLQVMYEFFPYMMKEVRRKGVTRHMMWEEYLRLHPDGFRRSQFQVYYNRWMHRVDPVMHLEHKAGDKIFVDYAGNKQQIVDKETGEIKEVEVFVSILASSQNIYVEAMMSQCKEDFIMGCEHALHYYGGCPQAIVSDNLKSAVIKSDKYEPTLNEAFLDFVNHYNMVALPAGPYKPRHKALVEGAVKIIYTQIYALLRNKVFYSLQELNEAMWEALKELNCKPMQGRKYSRQEVFEEIEKPELNPLPLLPYELKRKRIVTVARNGHVCLGEDKHYYSAPHEYIGKKVTIFYSQSEVEIYHKHERIATHIRNRKPHGHSTVDTHMASWQRVITDWNPDKFISWAATIHKDVKHYITEILDRRRHPEQAYKTCIGILALGKKVGNERLINACRRGILFNDYSYMTIKTIIEKGLDKTLDADELQELPMPLHDNIRGTEYYN
jgi:transposase